MSLSDKTKNFVEEDANNTSCILTRDVREFIKELKEKADIKIANHTMDEGEDLFTIKRKEIDELAGEDLI